MASCGQRADGSTPSYTTSGLGSAGTSTYYSIQYDDEITSTAAQTAFETFRKNCDADFLWMQNLFNSAASPWSGQMQVNIISGVDAPAGGGVGACWNSTSGPITLYPGVAANSSTATVDPWFLRYLLVSEVVEMFMKSTGSDWYGGNWSGGNEGSAGEGLSRFFGTELLIQNEGVSGGYSGFAVANKWMNSPRNDYVNNVDPGDIQIDPTIGCAAVFVYYLYTQLGCPITLMTANGAQQLAGVYANITGDQNNPFPFFKNLVDTGYPGTATITGPNLDNPWPIATMSFVGVKSTYGADESKDIINSPLNGLVSGAFTLWIDGLSQASFASLNIEVSAFSGNFASLLGVFIQPNPIGAQFESGVSQYAPSRIQIPFDVILSMPFLSQFPSSGTATYTLSASLTSGGNTVTASQASTQIELVAGADPYFTNIDSSNSNYPYLSQDLRVFMVTPGIKAAPIQGVPELADSVHGAYSYIQAVLSHFNDPVHGFTNPNGPDPFATNVLPSQGDWDQADSSVFPWTLNPSTHQPNNNYSFAIARVRLRGSSGVTGEASNVRVFFRLFATQSNDTDYDNDQNGTYAFEPDMEGWPGSPKVGVDNTTFPFFATGDFNTQTDYAANGVNNRTLIIPDHEDSLWAYYGCFLNLYGNENTFNNEQIQVYLTGSHHCLVAQIAFDDAPIPTGASPLSWDQLAQRNLQYTPSDNPGPASTHRIPQTFDCRPSKAYSALKGADTVYPDELMIDWGRIPKGSVAFLYWPQVLASDVVALAQQFYGATPLTASDAHTIRIPVTGGLSYVPIPSGGGQNFAGLFTVDLPPSAVHSGEAFDITVKRVGTKAVPAPPPPPPPPQIQTRSAPSKTRGAAATRRATHGEDAKRAAAPVAAPTAPATKMKRWRYVIGTFQVHIPVTTGDQILPMEQNLLAILKWRLGHMAPTDRWHPVLLRYIGNVEGRVNGLGGNAKDIPPSLNGFPPLLKPPCEAEEFTGKICEVLFDCHGDFDGFVLDDCCEAHLFRSRAKAIGKLALWACREQVTVSVYADRGPNRTIRRLAVKR